MAGGLVRHQRCEAQAHPVAAVGRWPRNVREGRAIAPLLLRAHLARIPVEVHGGNASPASGSRDVVAQNGPATAPVNRTTPTLAGTRSATQRPSDANVNRVRNGNASPSPGSRSIVAQNRPATAPVTRSAPNLAGNRSAAQPMRIGSGNFSRGSASSFTYRGNANAPTFSRPSATPSFSRSANAGSFRSGGSFAGSGASRMSSGGFHGGTSGGGFSHGGGGGGGGGFGHGR